MSSGSSTTQMMVRSRLSLAQMRQGSLSVTFWQTEQKVIRSLTSRIASASALASAAGMRSRWYVSRCALFGPTPGSLWNSSISRVTGAGGPSPPGDCQPPVPCSMFLVPWGRRGVGLSRQPGDVQPAGEPGQLLHLRRPDLLQRLVYRRHDQVLQHLHVRGVHHLRLDRDPVQPRLRVHHHRHGAAAGGRLDRRLLQLLLGLRDLALQRLELLHHLGVHPTLRQLSSPFPIGPSASPTGFAPSSRAACTRCPPLISPGPGRRGECSSPTLTGRPSTCEASSPRRAVWPPASIRSRWNVW